MFELWTWKTSAVLALNCVIFSLLEAYVLYPYVSTGVPKFLFIAFVSAWSGHWTRKTMNNS